MNFVATVLKLQDYW